MPPLPGFSDNPFQSRADLVAANAALLNPLKAYQSPLGARIRLPIATGTHFDEIAAQLEGFARPLWSIASLLAAQEGGGFPVDTSFQKWVDGFAVGADPSSSTDEYWGAVDDIDQRMVEIEILGFALLMAPTAFLGDPKATEKEALRKRKNIISYIDSVNGKEFPQNNWLWFRVIANLALVKSCGVPYETLKASMDADLKILDSFYVGGGWASDGAWSSERKQMDYYAGSFAIQYSQLMYANFASDVDPVRAKVFKARAREFSLDFSWYFDSEGMFQTFDPDVQFHFQHWLSGEILLFNPSSSRLNWNADF